MPFSPAVVPCKHEPHGTISRHFWTDETRAVDDQIVLCMRGIEIAAERAKETKG